MTVGVLYICTGRYAMFWDDFYTSSEQYLLPGINKKYFVFTDAINLPFKEKENVVIVTTTKKGWPFDTLMRYHDFMGIKADLKQLDYLFFFNANALFVAPVYAADILPDAHTSGLVGVLHPGYFNKVRKDFPYEKKQRQSLAHMPPNMGQHYYAGGINGGRTEAFLKLSETLRHNTQTDLDKNIIAVWHDESHINKYFAQHPPLTLSPAYVFPEGWELPFEPKILIRDKAKLGGHNELRGVETKQSTKIQSFKSWLLHKLRK